MNWLEALILGLLQGLTEFLPVSSSGHLEIGTVLSGNDNIGNNLAFTVAVHVATVLSTIAVFRKDLFNITTEALKFKWNDSSRYVLMILISMIPVGIVGMFFKDYVEDMFTGNTLFVGSMLIITALLLAFAHFIKPKEKKLSFLNTFIVGIAQAIAVIPGISRSGATISTGLILGIPKEQVARFSFLMVIIPIFGEGILDILTGGFANSGISLVSLLTGFFAAFISGIIACKFMISIVSKGKLIWFSIYCVLAGTLTIILSL